MNLALLNLLRNIKQTLCRQFQFDRGTPKQSILIFGAGRSGTTWLTHTLGQIYHLRVIFEPFWHKHLKVDSTADFFHFKYIREKNHQYDESIEYLLSGKYTSCDIAKQFIDVFHGRIIKEICANLILPHIIRLSENIPIIILIRNPFEVVLSRLNVRWGRHSHIYNSQNDLLEDFLDGNQILPNEEPDEEWEDHLICWCYENLIYHQYWIKNDSRLFFIVYDQIKKNPDPIYDSFKNYMSQFNQFKQHQPNWESVHLTKKKQYIVEHKKLSGEKEANWRNNFFDQEKKNKANEIFSFFGLSEWIQQLWGIHEIKSI